MMNWTRFSNPTRKTPDEVEREVDRIMAEQDRMAAEKLVFGNLVWEEFASAGILVIPASERTGMTRVSLTKSTYPGVQFQVTRWDAEGPVGHLDASSREIAVEDLWYYAGMTGWRERWAQRERVR